MKMMESWFPGDDQWKKVGETLAVGSISSVVSVSVSQPIDVASKVARKRKSGLLQAMARVMSEKGWRGLFKGNQLQILRKVPTKMVRVLTYEWSNNLLRVVRSRKNFSLPPVVDNVVVSTFAAAFSVAVTYPLHVMYVLRSRGLSAKFLTPKGFYRGVTPLCISTIPGVAIELFTYNLIRDHHPDVEQDFIALLSLSLVTRLVGQTFAQPFKIVNKDLLKSSATTGMRASMSRIVQEKGPLGLFKGMKYKYMKIVVSFVVARMIQQQLISSHFKVQPS